MAKPLLFVANWKMNMPFHAACSFIHDNKIELEQLINHTKITLVICPSFITISTLVQTVQNIPIYIGAQNCSEYSEGSYTGEVDAPSLHQAGCSYGIVGHSERRIFFKETNKAIAQKAFLLLKNNITPIICIGETKEEYLTQQTFDVLEKQLMPLWDVIGSPKTVIIAYEPIWSIGTGIIPEKPYLQKIFDWLSTQCAQHLPKTSIRLLYGGSVDQDNTKDLIQISGVNGLLVGGASLDFQKLKNIVSLMNN
ncbi:MAG: triose-phosphate isomerase [bacterium]|nr:triose-phosphate isomerase [bacterium]